MDARMRWVPKGLVAIAVVVMIAITWRTLRLLEKHMSPLADRPECPHDWKDGLDTTIYTPALNGQFSLPQEYTNVPEYHDCQRLIVGSPGARSYAQLAAVFLSADIIKGGILPQAGVTQPVVLPDLSGPRLGVTVNRGLTLRTAPQPIASATVDTALGVPYVEVVSEGDYPHLGIRNGFNCLYIRQAPSASSFRVTSYTVRTGQAQAASVGATPRPSTTSTDPRIQTAAPNAVALPSGGSVLTAATMVSFGLKEVDCRNPTFDDQTDFEALQIRVIARDSRPNAIPFVTRWGWDETTGIHLIGIPCATDSYCEVGPFIPFVGSASYAGPAGNGPEKTIPSWFDEQYLASESPTGLVPSAIKGTVFPAVLDLGKKTFDFYAGKPGSTFKDVAHVAVTAKDNVKYYPRYLFDAAPAAGPYMNMATVALCYGEADACGIPAGSNLRKTCKATTQKPGVDAIEHPWWARITAPDTDTQKYYCVAYRGHHVGVIVPNVVRWRWRVEDETIWIPCPSACCEVDSDQR